jgi:hypothetical protein
MLYDEIYEALQMDYNKRLTQIDIAKKYNTTQGSIHRLLSEPANILGIKLETLQKMFPNSTIYGKTQPTNNQKVISPINSTVTQNNSSFEKKDFVSDLSRKILNHADLTAEEKIKFLQILDTQ